MGFPGSRRGFGRASRSFLRQRRVSRVEARGPIGGIVGREQKTMNRYITAPRALVGTFFLTCLAAGCTPVDNRTANRAEDACLDAAHDDGYRNVRTTEAPLALAIRSSSRSPATGTASPMTAPAPYDRQRRRASISWERGNGGSGSFSKARAACQQRAQSRNLTINVFDQGDRSGNAIVFDMRLRESATTIRACAGTTTAGRIFRPTSSEGRRTSSEGPPGEGGGRHMIGAGTLRCCLAGLAIIAAGPVAGWFLKEDGGGP